MRKKLCLALALALLTTGCSGLGLWLSIAGRAPDDPTQEQPVQAGVQPEPPARPAVEPVELWDPAALALSAREGRYRLRDPFGSGEELPLPEEVTQAACEVAVTDLSVQGRTLYVALLRLPYGKAPNGALYRSTDQGEHWDLLCLPELALGEEEQVADLFLSFWSEEGGSLVVETDLARRLIWCTADGGSSWSLDAVQESGDPDAWLCGGGFVSGQMGFLASTADGQTAPQVSITRDGGLTWQPLPMELPELPGLLRAEALTPQCIGEAVVLPVRVYQSGAGAAQQVRLLQYITRDGGETWAFADD